MATDLIPGQITCYITFPDSDPLSPLLDGPARGRNAAKPGKYRVGARVEQKAPLLLQKAAQLAAPSTL